MITQLELDNSKRSTFQECPRKFYWNYDQHLVSKRGSSALRFGSVLHRGLEEYYKIVLENGLPAIDDYSKRCLLAMKDEWDTATDEREDWWLDWRTFENCVTTFLNYVQYWEEVDKDAGIEVLQVEDKFTLALPPISGIPLNFIGRIDLVLRLHGTTHVMDHKTTSMNLNIMSNRVGRSAQTIGYLYATQVQHPEFEAHDFFINYCYSHANKSRSRDSLAQQAAGGGALFTGFKNEFLRMPEIHTERIMAEWVYMFRQTAAHIVECYKKDFFPMNFDSCEGKYGKCTYLGLCEQQCGFREANTESYTKSEWDPRR